MEIGARLRSEAYWLRDGLAGGHVRHHMDDIAHQMSDPVLRQRLTSERLERLITHATETTNFYRAYRGINSLESMPVTTKRTIKENYDTFFSTTYPRQSLHPAITSGSYGTPFTFYLNTEKKLRQRAEILFFGQWAGFTVGKRFANCRLVKHWSRWQYYIHNEVALDTRRMDDNWYSQSRDLLQRRKVRILIGHPSAIWALARYCISKKVRPSSFTLEGAIAYGETVNDEMRQDVQDAFGVQLLSRYSTTELGVLAMEDPTSLKHVVNAASYIIEILSLTQDTPVAPGEIGRVVATDLFSYAMPLIRYDTGDLAAFSAETTPIGKVTILERLEGRQVETISDVNGVRLSPFVIIRDMKTLRQVYQFQFIQTGPATYELKLVVQEPFYEENTIRERLKLRLGAETQLTLTYLDNIPPLPSGKRPCVLNRMQ